MKFCLPSFFRVIFMCTPPQGQLPFLYFLTQTIVCFAQFSALFFYSLHAYLIKSPLAMGILGCYNNGKKKRFSISFSFSYLSFRGHPGIVWSTIPGLSIVASRHWQFVPRTSAYRYFPSPLGIISLWRIGALHVRRPDSQFVPRTCTSRYSSWVPLGIVTL